ncbi:hypothetical protein [Thermus oshimai]|uniref:hypothetical protein n=1 Tax=Thermus oshimai TaxID=56957 RepID=UPI00036ACC72|nr:hypothetical protein [Thermus oshimai]
MLWIKGKVVGATERESKFGNRYAVGTVEVPTSEGKVRLPFLAFGAMGNRAKEAVGEHALLVGQAKAGREGLEMVVENLHILEVEDGGGRFTLVGAVVGAPRTVQGGSLVQVAVPRRNGVEILPVWVMEYAPLPWRGRPSSWKARCGGGAMLVATNVDFLKGEGSAEAWSAGAHPA